LGLELDCHTRGCEGLFEFENPWEAYNRDTGEVSCPECGTSYRLDFDWDSSQGIYDGIFTLERIEK